MATPTELLQEMSDKFDVYYNNITSNQAPGLNEYEKSIFLTKAQDELVKNYFNPKGNKYNEGFDGSRKRQADFSSLIKVHPYDGSSIVTYGNPFDKRSIRFDLLSEMYLIINEQFVLKTKKSATESEQYTYYTVVPISFEEYDRLMQKPYKYPPKHQIWRLLTTAEDSSTSGGVTTTEWVRNVELIGLLPEPNPTIPPNSSNAQTYPIVEYDYRIRYIKKPNPIILVNLNSIDSSLTINGENTQTPCELPEHMHEEIIQRAVELAKIAWTSTGQDNMQSMIQAGERSE